MAPPPFVTSDAAGWAVPGVTGLGVSEPLVLPPASERIRLLQQLLAEESAVAAVELPGPQALADTAGLLVARDALDRLVLARVGDVEVRRLAPLVGAASTASWLRAQPVDAPVGAVATARRLLQHPSLGEAVADGRLSPRQAEQLGRTLATLRPHLDRPGGLIDGHDAQPVLAAVVVDGVVDLLGEAFGGPADDTPAGVLLAELADELSEIAWQVQTSQLDRVERAVVLLAQHLPPAFLPSALARLSDALLPTRLEDAADRLQRDRRLTLTPLPDGGGLVNGQLTGEAYELLHTVLSAAAETDPDNPVDTQGWRAARQDGWQPGDPLPDGGPVRAGRPRLADTVDPLTGQPAPPLRPTGQPVRSRPQRMHDALVLGLRRLLDSGALGSRGKTAPHVGVTVSLNSLVGAPGALPAVGDSGQRLPLSLVTSWLQDAWVTRFVLDLRHRVVETSHRERTLKAHERRIKDVEIGHACQNAHCARGTDPPPGTRLVPHHAHAWARTGTTSVLDTVLLCEADHHHLHAGATLTLRDGRRLTADGWLD